MVYETIEDAVEGAKNVLEGNWTGHSTVPAWGLYPHQWAWDSGLTAIGYAHYDQGKAESELLSLFRGQWKNGMLPHMLFSKECPDYFPGASYWEVRRSPNAPRDIDTTGCVQPPVHAIASYEIFKDSKDTDRARRFLRKIYPSLCAWHDYLYRERDPDRDGMIYIRHPWESGRDNSPVWDEVLARPQFDRDEIPIYTRTDSDDWKRDGRPNDRHYDTYIYLCELFKKADYDEEEIRENCPFLVQDLLFNSILVRSGRCLAEIARAIGADPRQHDERADLTVFSMRDRLWSDSKGIFLPYDRVDGKMLDHHEVGGFSPLYGDVPTPEQAKRMCDLLHSKYFCPVDCDDCFAITSYSRSDVDYDPLNYWRGPVWININWIIARGLRGYGYHDHERWIVKSIRDLPMKNGFRERYHAETGEPQGGVNFSWSAALFLDCYYEGLFNELEDLHPIKQSFSG